MTKHEQKEEATSRLVPTQTTLALPNVTPPTTPTCDPTYVTFPPSNTPKYPLNSPQGTAAWCLDTIVQSNDLMEARARIKVRGDEGWNLNKAPCSI